MIDLSLFNDLQDLNITTRYRVADQAANPVYETPPRWYLKANAYAAAWSARIKGTPSTSNVTLGLAIAQHETWCGDAWTNEHNWGAVQKRGLNEAERAALQSAGIAPNPKNVQAARVALQAAGIVPFNEALHVDSSPNAGWYFVYFWAFPTDTEGAAMFIHVLAEQRPACKLLLESSDASGNEYAMAFAMYRSHYFEGFRDPHQPGGQDGNIEDYASAIIGLRPGIARSLANWSPGAVAPTSPIVPVPPDPHNFNLSSVLGLQQALNFLMPVPIAEDGIMGPKTCEELRNFQTSRGLKPDGIVGPLTITAFKTALGITP